MAKNVCYYTLSDLFYALFTAEEGDPAIQGIGKCNREMYFKLFYPKELYDKYISKSKSNLTWFFNNDYKNKAVKRTLIEMLEKDSNSMIQEVHRKCREILWPSAGHASFDSVKLLQILSCVKISGSINASCKIIDKDNTGKLQSCKLLSYYEIDASSALARMILTLSVLPDASEEVVGRLWEAGSIKKEKERQTDEELFRYYQLIDQEGKKEEAFHGYAELIPSVKKITQEWESKLYVRVATMLVRGEGHHADAKKAMEYFKASLSDMNPESYYLYSHQLNGKEALKNLQKAADLLYPLALRELGNAYYFSGERLDCQKDMTLARECYQKGSVYEGETGAYCAYMLGRIHEENSDTQEALEMYRHAAEKGSHEAYERLLQLKWESYDPKDHQKQTTEKKYDWINGLTGANRSFIRSLSDTKRATVLVDTADQEFGNWFEKTYKKEEYIEIILLSEDEKKNMDDCISVIRFLYRYAKINGDSLIDHVKIYVAGQHDTLTVLLDNLFVSMRPFYLQVYVCDMHEDAAADLFTKAPLFIPCMEHPDHKTIRMNIIGNSNIILSLIRHAIRLPLPSDADMEIHAFSQKAEDMEKRFYDECPGIQLASPMIKRVQPVFHQTSHTDILRTVRTLRLERLSGINKKDIDETIIDGNYYVICTEDDMENIRIGCALRRELLKTSSDFDRTPFIAVYTRDEISSILASSMQEGTVIQMPNQFSRYDLFPFGSYGMYASELLRNNVLENRAYAIHSFYNPEDTQKTYFARSFNRDSSKAEAESLIYRLFQTGICPDDWHEYGNAKTEKQLAVQYTAWLQKENHLMQAAEWEHDRWNAMMLTYGWEQASVSRVSSYVQQGNPGHQMNLAKLHPFICEWEALRSGKLTEEIRDIVNGLYPEKTVYNPVEFDQKSVQETERIINGSFPEE
ncbi:MAG: sel1 repeat family protein [Solobacterium sp.]|nr:sel1 repeat family protein [Solobacterium sp.]